MRTTSGLSRDGVALRTLAVGWGKTCFCAHFSLVNLCIDDHEIKQMDTTRTEKRGPSKAYWAWSVDDKKAGNIFVSVSKSCCVRVWTSLVPLTDRAYECHGKSETRPNGPSFGARPGGVLAGRSGKLTSERSFRIFFMSAWETRECRYPPAVPRRRNKYRSNVWVLRCCVVPCWPQKSRHNAWTERIKMVAHHLWRFHVLESACLLQLTSQTVADVAETSSATVFLYRPRID